MDNNSRDRNSDLTHRSSKKEGQYAKLEANELEVDEVNENSSLGNVSTPQGDNAGENKIATSLDNE